MQQISAPNAASPLVTVCIPNYNGMGVIDECIQSVMAQQGDFAIDIVIHDDKSSDGSVAHIRATYPRVTVIESAINVGFCVANNRMAAIATGEYLLLLNNDAALYPDAIRTLFDEAQRLRQPAILTLPQYDAGNGLLLDIGARLDPFLNPIPNLDPLQNDVGMAAGACLWINRSLWDQLKGFPSWFESIGEDLYLCCRARRWGHPVRALGVSGYRHHVGASFGGGKTQDGRLSTSFRRRALSERNKTFSMVVCYPSPAMQLMLPIHLGVLLLEGLTLSLVLGNPAFLLKIYLPVVSALLRRRKELKAARSEVALKSGGSRIRFFSAFNLFPYKLTMFLRHGLPKVR